MRIVKTRRGFAVAADGLPGYAHEGTRKACQAYIDRATQVRAELAEFEAAAAERVARLLSERGIGPVDYRQLKPGDLFTWRPEVPRPAGRWQPGKQRRN